MNRHNITLTLICLISIVSVPASAQMEKDEALTEFVAGGMAYKDGRYEAAIEHYQKIIEGGRVSGPLLYNLGNSYFKRGMTGKAVLQYERSKRLIPRDSDLKFNYTFALSKAEQYGGNETLNATDRAVRGFIQFYTVDEMVFILTLTVFSFGVLFLVFMYLQWPAQWTRSSFAVLGIIFLIYGGGLILKVQYERDLAVVMQNTESYFEPRNDSTVHFKISEGMKVRIVKDEANWLKVEREDGKVGWVDRSLLERI